jgi:hypothetical protein
MPKTAGLDSFPHQLDASHPRRDVARRFQHRAGFLVDRLLQFTQQGAVFLHLCLQLFEKRLGVRIVGFFSDLIDQQQGTGRSGQVVIEVTFEFFVHEMKGEDVQSSGRYRKRGVRQMTDRLVIGRKKI